ncbi:MAG: hypothetical protein V3U90_02950 [Dehalococcoidia bacterium]
MTIQGRKSLLFLSAGSLLILMAVIAAVATWQLTSGEGNDISIEKPRGPLASDFTVPTLNGDFQLAQQLGKVTVLYFSFPG